MTISSRANFESVGGPLTMLDVEYAIARHRDAFKQHPFLKRLEGQGTLEQFRRMVPRHAFFTLVFQDVLRLACSRCSNAQVLAVAEELKRGDRGHERWYLADLSHLGIEIDVRWIFSDDHALARDVGYQLVWEVSNAGDDRTRLSVVLSLEAIAGEFFLRVPGFAERLGVSDGLKYFGLPHLDAEESHEVFADAGRSALDAILVSDSVVPEVLGAVERTFALMAQLADDLENAMRG